MLRSLVLGAGLILVLGVQGALAFTLTPMRTLLTLPSDMGGETILLRNPRKDDLPVVFEVFERKVNEDGSEESIPADDAFVVFPPQAVVPAGKTQAVRIQWVGGALSQSRSFHLYAREMPVNLEGEKKNGITTLFRVGAAINLTSKGFASKAELVHYKPEQDGVIVSIGNLGNEFIYVNELGLKFGGKEIEGKELSEAAGKTLIPPGVIRTFKIPSVQGAPELIVKN